MYNAFQEVIILSELGNKQVFANNLQKYMNKTEIDRYKLCEDLNFKYSTVSEWLAAKKYPRIDKIEILANYFNILKSDLIEDKDENIYKYKNVIPLPKTSKIPLLGEIACGEPIFANENIECDVDLPENIRADFALKCKGDSMIDAHIYNGDIVYIRQQATVNDGEIAAVLIENEATLKRFYKSGDTVTLMPCSTKCQPFVYSGAELENIRILGKAVGFTSTKI